MSWPINAAVTEACEAITETLARLTSTLQDANQSRQSPANLVNLARQLRVESNNLLDLAERMSGLRLPR